MAETIEETYEHEVRRTIRRTVKIQEVRSKFCLFW